MFSGVTLPLDRSPLAASALPYALALGDALGVPVTLLHAVPVPGLSPGSPLRNDRTEEATVLAQAANVLEARAQSLRGGARRIETAVVAGDAAEAITCAAERHAGQCIVMATHGAGGMLHWAFGSVARKVLTTTTLPTLIVRPAAAPARPEEPAMIRRILVPLDGSDLAFGAVPVVKELATALGAAVTLARVVPIPTAMYVTGPYTPMIAQPYLNEAIATERETATTSLDQIAGELHDAGIATASVVQSGPAANRLLDLLEDGAFDLVVMSSHGRRGVKRLVLGSVAERLVESSHTPILIVHAPSPPITAP